MGRRKLTNKFNLPITLVRAIEYDTHVSKGTISVTELISGPRLRKLKQQHDYEMDVSEGIYALMGTALHHVLERSNVELIKKNAFIMTADTLMKEAIKLEASSPQHAHNFREVANYLFQLIPVIFPEIGDRYIFELTLTLDFGDHVLSGTFDLFDKETGILYDYKFCSTYNYMFPEAREKWDEQTNIYAFMLMNNGYNVVGIRIVAFFRDWNQFGYMKNRAYPPRQIMEIPITLRNVDIVANLVETHLNRHRSADAGNIPDCSGKQRWATADEFAVKAEKFKKALTIAPSREIAEQFMKDNAHKKTNLYIEVRPGESRFCAEYCPVSKVCPQYAKELQTREKIKQLDQQPIWK